MRRRNLPTDTEDNFWGHRWAEHEDIVQQKSKLWAKAQPERWKDLDPWKDPEIFGVFHCLKGSLLPDMIDELGEGLHTLLARHGVEMDARKIGIEIIVPLVRKFAGGRLNFPSDRVINRCLQEATIWMELGDAQNSEKAETTRTLALRYDTTPGKIQKIFQRMSEEYGKVE